MTTRLSPRARPGADARVQAVWSFDGTEQRSAVKIYVGDDQVAVQSAAGALSRSRAIRTVMSLSPQRRGLCRDRALLVLVDATADPGAVAAAVKNG